jgi:hypothetical protein
MTSLRERRLEGNHGTTEDPKVVEKRRQEIRQQESAHLKDAGAGATATGPVQAPSEHRRPARQRLVSNPRRFA